MVLNKQKGNMYGFVTHTWNPIKGRCKHNCIYCYMHRKWKMMKNDELRLDVKEFKEFDRDMIKYGDSGHFIFVGSSTDIWIADEVWIAKVLAYTAQYPDNTYLFQTKAPKFFDGWHFDQNNIIGITLESNRHYPEISKAINPQQRIADFYDITHNRKMITIEPVLDFDLESLVFMIKSIDPEWVNIGADSLGNDLPEPSKDKVLALIDRLKPITTVKNKTNLKRLL